jgi:hypothetical protein
VIDELDLGMARAPFQGKDPADATANVDLVNTEPMIDHDEVTYNKYPDDHEPSDSAETTPRGSRRPSS